jgi:hypothetical protein
VASPRVQQLVIGALEQIEKELKADDREFNALERQRAERGKTLIGQAGRWATVVGELRGIGAELAPIPALELPQAN